MKTQQRSEARQVLAVMLLFASMGTVLAGDVWVTDFEAAKKQAQEEKKDLFIDFTGSDWCGWCKRLDKEVFSKPLFLNAMLEDFVFVKLDFPRETEQSAEVKAQNQKLQQEFQVRGFPTIFLATADGTPYARTGYQRGGPEAYVKHLAVLRAGKNKLEELTTQIEAASGVERAKLLDQLVEHKAKSGLPIEMARMQEIIELDAADAAGLKSKYSSKQALSDLQMELGAAAQARDLGKLGSLLDAALQEPVYTPQDRQQLYMARAKVHAQSGELDSAIAQLEKAKETAPESPLGKQIPSFIEQIKARQAEAAAPADGAAPAQ